MWGKASLEQEPGHQEQWASLLILGGGTRMGVVALDPSSGYCTYPTYPPFLLPQSRIGNGLGPPFILRSWALPSMGLEPKGELNGFLITWAVPQPPWGLGQSWYV